MEIDRVLKCEVEYTLDVGDRVVWNLFLHKKHKVVDHQELQAYSRLKGDFTAHIR